MRTFRPTILLVTFAVALGFGACGDDGGATADTSGGSDTSSTADTGGGGDTGEVSDTGAGADTAAPADTTTPPAGACTETGFISSQETMEVEADLVIYRGMGGTEASQEQLSIEIYQGAQYGGATGPGTFPLTGNDGNYATCGNCVLVRAECNAQGCAKTFMVDEGSLVIDTLDSDGFSGRLADGAIAKEVTIDGTTFESTLVEGGATWCLDGYAFTAAPAEIPRFEGTTEATCVAEGNGVYLGANIGDLSLPNCNGDMVSLHDTCGTAKALHLVGTAVWCTACEAEIEQLLGINEVNKANGDVLTRALVAQKTPGLDMLVILAEDNGGNQPSQAECKAYAQKSGLDPAMVLIDWNDPAIDVPLAMAPGFALPVQGLGKTWEKINPYLEVQGESVQVAFPWNAVLNGTNREFVWIDTQGPGTLDGALNGLLAP